MYGDTITLSIDGDSCVFTRINPGEKYSGEFYYRKAGEWEARLRVRHSRSGTLKTGMRDRHNVELTRLVYAENPGEEAYQEKAYLVVEQPYEQASDVLCLALVAWSTSANLTKLVDWET